MCVEFSTVGRVVVHVTSRTKDAEVADIGLLTPEGLIPDSDRRRVCLVVGNVAGDFLIDRRRAWRTSRLYVRPHDSNVFGVICTPADETECHTLRHLQKPFEQFANMVHILVDKY